MHPLLVHFNIISGWDPLVSSEETAVKFLTDMGLIPPRDALMFCPICGCEMVSSVDTSQKAGFRFYCKNRRKAKCKGRVPPLKNTFFEGSRIPIRDVLAIIICFVLEFSVSFACTEMCAWRKSRGEDLIHFRTIGDYYDYCKDIAATQKSPKSDNSQKTDIVQETPSGPKSRGEKIYDFLIAMRKIYPGPGKVGLEIKSLVHDKSTDWEETQLNSSE